jgi:WD repeat-containing protein 44
MELPRIRVRDVQNADDGASPVDTPSTTTEGGLSARPTSSEGMISLGNESLQQVR